MKISFAICIFWISMSFSQTDDCNCFTELDFVASKLKESVSYKSQLKDSDSTQKHLKNVKAQMKLDENLELNCRAYLQKFLTIVKDRHLGISSNADVIDYKSMAERPKYSIEELEGKLLETTDSIAGEYRYLDKYKVALLPEGNNLYKAYILGSEDDNWQTAQIKFQLRRIADGFEAIFYNNVHSPRYEKIVFKNGRLTPTLWHKVDVEENYKINPYDVGESTFLYEELDKNLHYVKLGSFSGSNKNYSEASELLKILENNVNKGTIILDLRNNGGGGSRTSDLFRKFLKNKKDELKVAVIQNNYCASDCEQFLLKLRNQQTVQTFGENTRGAVAYGYGNRSTLTYKTPCKNLTLYLTTSKYEKFSEYEIVGIAPDNYLNLKHNWLEQVVNQLSVE